VSQPGSSEDDAERLRKLIQAFVRRFGLLVTRETPCGHPVSPSYAHALMVLLPSEGDVSQTELGDALGIDKSNVTRLCARMEDAGHVVQERRADDGRGRSVRLTGAGMKMARRIDQSSRERFARIVDAIDEGHRRSLFASLERLNAALETLREEA